MSYFFRIPFAQSGDVLEIPQPLQIDGAVSFTQGYTFDYERVLYDPDRRNVEREPMNFLFNAITGALNQYQTFGVPEFITSADNGGSPYSYDEGARCVKDGVVYISLEDGNEDTPPSAKWRKEFLSTGSMSANNGWYWTELGFIVQWGTQTSINAQSGRNFNLPVAVDTHFGGFAQVPENGYNNSTNFIAISNTQGRIFNGSVLAKDIFWISLGYKARS